MKLSILYRGPLASCNYGCTYCPFAKQRDSVEELEADRHALQRFVSWVGDHPELDLSILFTPWGEALTRQWYRDAMVSLSHLHHVTLVAAQTNLSRSVDWVAAADACTLSLWCTFHPTEDALDRFVGRCHRLDSLGIQYSVGVVGFPEHLLVAGELRERLNDRTYLWVNPASGLGRDYTAAEVANWVQVDRLFPLALRPHESLGRPCRAGESAVSVDGSGSVRRCHFVDDVIGNLYDGTWRDGLRRRTCPIANCDCFIGYVHRDADLYDSHFGERLLSRVPLPEPLLSLGAPNES